MEIGLNHFLAVSTILLAIGLAGVLLRRNIYVLGMSLVIMALSIVILLAAFSHFGANFVQPSGGEAFAVLVIVSTTANILLGIGVIRLWQRRYQNILIDVPENEPDRR